MSNFIKMSEQKKSTSSKTITLDTSIMKTIEQRAVQENRNFSNMVETLLKQATAQTT